MFKTLPFDLLHMTLYKQAEKYRWVEVVYRVVIKTWNKNGLPFFFVSFRENSSSVSLQLLVTTAELYWNANLSVKGFSVCKHVLSSLGINHRVTTIFFDVKVAGTPRLSFSQL